MRCSSDQVNWIRPPEVEGSIGDWWSRFLIASACGGEVAETFRTTAINGLLGAEVSSLDEPGLFRLTLHTKPHPMDEEGWAILDIVFVELHALVGISKINDSDMIVWRPFRDDPQRYSTGAD